MDFDRQPTPPTPAPGSSDPQSGAPQPGAAKAQHPQAGAPQPGTAMPQGRRRMPLRRPVSLAATGLGLVLVIAGSFLPWLTSGQVVRNSYQLSAIAERLEILGDGFATAVLAAWPLLGPVSFLPVIAALLRWWRIAGGLAVVVGVPTALLSAVVLAVASGKSAAGIALEPTGPVVMLIGGMLLVGAGSVLLTVHRPRIRMGMVSGEERRVERMDDRPSS